jgi:hypothetical protein
MWGESHPWGGGSPCSAPYLEAFFSIHNLMMCCTMVTWDPLIMPSEDLILSQHMNVIKFSKVISHVNVELNSNTLKTYTGDGDRASLWNAGIWFNINVANCLRKYHNMQTEALGLQMYWWYCPNWEQCFWEVKNDTGEGIRNIHKITAIYLRCIRYRSHFWALSGCPPVGLAGM